MPRTLHLDQRIVPALIVLLVGAHGASALDSPKTLADYSVTNWTETDGPFPLGIYAVAQDKLGFLWLGARTGLVRFDGTNFVLWNERVPLPRGAVSTVCTSKDGAVWVGFSAGEGVSRVDTDRVTNYAPGDGLVDGHIRTLVEDADGTIWAGSYGGLSQFRGGRWQTVGPARGVPKAGVQAIAVDKRGALWVGSSVGVYRRAAGQDSFRFVSADLARGFSEDESGAIWVTDPATAFKRLVASAPSWPPARQDALIGNGTALLEDRRGNLWVGTRGGGLIVFRRTVDQSAGLIERFRRRDGLADDYVRTLFEDRDGSIWVGTRGGLSRLFESNITQVRDFADSGNAVVHAVLSSRDHSLWIATADGLLRIRNGRVTRYGVADGLPGRVSTALYEDGAGTLWVATTSGVARFTGSRFSPVRLPREIGIEQIFSLTIDRQGRIWLCDDLRGLVRWQAGQIELLSQDPQGNLPHVVYTDSSDRVWVGFLRNGLEAHQGESVVPYGLNEGLPPGTVHVIYEDSSGVLWVGTAGGLARFDGERFRTFTTNGLPASDIGSIVEDDRHDLWLGLTAGLMRVKRDEFTQAVVDRSHQIRYRFFGKEEGLSGILARPGTPSAARTSDGSLVFATSVAVARVRPNRLSASPKVGFLRIEEIVVDGHLLQPVAGLRLAPHTARIDIDYAVLGFTTSPSLRFRYILEGFDHEWQDAGVHRQARYTNLAPGPYRFRVMHGTSEGGWNEPAAVTLDFSILPAMYQTYSFKFVCTVLAVCAIALAWRARLRLMRRRFELVLAERTRVARDLHDTLLQSLAAVALDYHDISGQLDPSADALRAQVIHARERVEHHLRETRQAIWNLRSPALDRGGLIEALREAGELATSGRSVEFDWMVRGTPSRLTTHVEEQLLRIGQEAVTNAVRHGRADIVRVALAYESCTLTLRISDDGVGFDVEAAETEPGHWGITNMRDRARQVGASLTVVSREGLGTTIEVAVPLSAA
jgi:signal transduction histidine kinase